MLFTSWLTIRGRAAHRTQAERHGRHKKGARPARARLYIEQLEDRCVLSSSLSASLVADILPGAPSSTPANLTNVGGSLYFAAQDAIGGAQLWKSDGTPSGTVMLAPVPGSPSEFTPMNGSVFFSTGAGYLWKTDGTASGTVQVGAETVPHDLTVVNGKLFFNGEDANGSELWVSDGTSAGTVLVKDIYGGGTFTKDRLGGGKDFIPNSSDPLWLTNFNGKLFFAATSSKGRLLWESDGTASGTKQVTTDTASSHPAYLTALNSVLYFGNADGLWKSDGTAKGTVLIKPFVTDAAGLTITADGDYYVSRMVNINGTVYFAADNGVSGAELWKTDGTAAGTVLVKDINPGSAGSNPVELTNVNGTLYFVANGNQLWKSDGTAAGTVMLASFQSVPDTRFRDPLTNVNGLLYFAADDGVHGTELWQSDGTAAGTMMVQDIDPGSASSDPSFLTAMNNKLYFSADDGVHGVELWDPPPVGGSGYLYVPTFDTNAVLRFNEMTGAPAPSPGNTGSTFIPAGTGGLAQPDAVLIGPDGNLYVSSGFFKGFKAILRFDSTTGAPLPTPGNTGATFGDTATVFANDSSLTTSTSPFTVRTMLFGPDGNLYVAVGYDGSHKKGWVDRFDGTTGAYLGKFVTDNLSQNGGLMNPQGIVFGPDGKGDGKLDLYIASSFVNSSNNDVKRYDGTTGQFLGEFVASGSDGLHHAAGLTFGPDGNLYVVSGGWDGQNGGINGLAAVLRYEGPASPDKLPPGTFLGIFVQPDSGGLNSPFGLLFGPDGNADGRQDLYVSTELYQGAAFNAKKDTSAILRYDGATGSFIDALVPFGSVGMDNPGYMAFTETDPTTLAFTGFWNLGAKAIRQNNSASISPAITQISIAADQNKLLDSGSMAGAIRFGALTAEVASRPPALSEPSATLPKSPRNDGETSQTGVSMDWEKSRVALGWLFDHVPNLDGNTVWDVLEGNEVPHWDLWSERIGVIEK
jgi:ELWxxDGT repeat protein